MKVLVSGSSGLVGSALIPRLVDSGHEAVRLVRSAPGAGEVHWNPKRGEIDAEKLEGFDGVVHLAGENIAEGRWNAAKKARIRDSRIDGTRLLSETLARLERRPDALVAASAIGFYGDRGDERLDEGSSGGSGFLADVCRDWESASAPAAEKGVRVVHLRTGMVLSTSGGALAKMLLPFRLGVGGVVGNGRQYVSWITIDDLVSVIVHALENASLAGPVNSVAPGAVTNRQFTKALGSVLSRPTVFPMPAFAARLVFGEMADEILLSSARVEPARLQASGFEFRHPEIEAALRHVVGG